MRICCRKQSEKEVLPDLLPLNDKMREKAGLIVGSMSEIRKLF